MSVSGDLIVITAPSGAGKSSLIKRLMEEDINLTFSVSYTTRQPRVGEKHGVDYYFIEKAEFESKIQGEAFLEYAQVHGEYYGTAYEEVRRLEESGRRVLLDIDVQGALNIMPRIKGTYIFITVQAGVETLKERLEKRGLDSPAVIQKRLSNAVWELEQSHQWPYLVCNEQFESSLEKLRNIIYQQNRPS